MNLVQELKVLLSNVVMFRYKAHGYHWNVEGDDFHAYHDFFNDIYSDAEGSIDDIAECIRKLGEYAPFKLSEFIELAEVKDASVPTESLDMAADLLTANKVVIDSIYRCLKACEEENAQGVLNFLAGRAEMHEKWNWQLTATVKSGSKPKSTKDSVRKIGGITIIK